MGHDGPVRHRLLAALVVVAVPLSACGGGDGGDLEAYCQLLVEGKGLTASNEVVQAEDLAALLKVAPREIRDAVQELSNTTRGLRDIDELDQLFSAAFDPDAQAARAAFTEHAVRGCGLDSTTLPAGPVDSTAALVDGVEAYVEGNFAGAAWVPKVRYDIQRVDGGLDGITVTFIIDAEGDEPIQACNAVAVYLYALSGGRGEVAVVADGLVVARRAGPEAPCELV